VVDQPLCRSRRIQGLPPKEEVRKNSPPPPLRFHIDQFGAFISTHSFKVTTTEPPTINALELEVVTIEDLIVEEYALDYNPLLTGTFSSLVVKVL
jgi:hypothetical protein